jgi:hypothetical protein
MENYPLHPQNVASGKGKTRSMRESREERNGVWFSNAHISFKIYTENVEFNAFHLRMAMFVKDLGLELMYTY